MATRHIRDTGVSYRIYGEENERSWPINPLPLILGEAEWAQIADGVEQRARLMEALLQDLYGEARLLADGALPAAAVTGSNDFIRAMRGVKPRGGRYLQLYAADLGRGPDGRWWVLDDRTQAPSGAGYALENRLVLSRAYPNLYNAMNVQRLASFFDELRKGLAAAAERSDPRICLLTPGPVQRDLFRAGPSRALSGLSARRRRRSGRPRRPRLCAHHRRSEAGRRHPAPCRRRLRRSARAQQRVAAWRARPARGDPERRGGGAQHAGLRRVGVQGAAGLPAEALPPAAWAKSS